MPILLDWLCKDDFWQGIYKLAVLKNDKNLMIQREIINKKTGQKLIIFKDDDFEYEKPIKHYGDGFIAKQIVLRGIPNEELNGDKKPSENSKKNFIEAKIHSQEMFQKYKAVEVPNGFLKLFGTTKKYEQENLLKGQILTPDILMGLLIKAEEQGFTISQYSSEYSQKGFDFSKMPFAFQVKENGEVQTYGETELSDGQLKQAIEHRKVTIAKILDKGDEWHCFIVTFKSLRGEETWLGEKQPHYHYISNAFGIHRTEVINQIKSEKYKLGNLPHIKLEGYGNQPE